ncbi:predicted protein [Histoplasma capsulatum G186AR]|uniref:Uncharacterized protein n=2 Tax=Ajellomyces capsulatus TaxID=5037 RepID=C0NLT3_AJECG|nr:uncharacterized protein HCBG_04463 [Histoplasma capsulatum G186AR]EEH07584.1 predicted protein [Histoplasma capsulatum G186AR]KAG5304278.1 hypothetical protein I7I52_02551 [Histoplasma capsulatum]QSS69876.1 hypothetical protein I7I50_11313 [Histoplasma capsulatum G186AR]
MPPDASEMAGFYLPNILQRKTPPQANGNSPPQAEMIERDSPQHGSQQTDSQNFPNPDGHKSSWPSKYFASAFATRYGATKSAATLPSITSEATASQAINLRTRISRNSNNNNICKLPASVKRKPSDSPCRTPTRNTDLPIPTIIHPSTPISPSPSPVHSSPTRAKPHSTLRPSQRRSILKVAADDSDLRQEELYRQYTSQSDTRANTSRNVILTLSDSSARNDTSPLLPPSKQMSPTNPPVVAGDIYTIHSALGDREAEPEPERWDGYVDESGGPGSKASSKSGRSSSSVHSERENSQERNKKRRKKEKKAKKNKTVRFDHIDVHMYEVERGEEPRFRFFGRRGGGGGAEGFGNGIANANANANVDGNGSRRGRGAAFSESDLDIDRREYVMDIPDVIQG